MTTSAKNGASAAFKQKVRGIIKNLVDQYFSGTLGAEQDIVNYVMALIQTESSFGPSRTGLVVSEVPTPKQSKPSSRAYQYVSSNSVRAILSLGDTQQKLNVASGKVAHGLMQVMGWNIVRGGSSKTNLCEIEESKHPEIISRLVINPGDSIENKLLGEDNIENNILAGLAILESKYKFTRRFGTGWSAGGSVFPTRLAAAVGAYLGVGGVDLRTGITAEQYVDRILGGDSYRVANGSSSNLGTVTRTASSGAPSTNGSSVPATIPGCA
ncbi:MAG TPA: hypothetical protein VFM18_05285 [Methanosarcina sp.]|nr:hypothetical protein [Methanosarcina sp.]